MKKLYIKYLALFSLAITSVFTNAQAFTILDNMDALVNELTPALQLVAGIFMVLISFALGYAIFRLAQRVLQRV